MLRGVARESDSFREVDVDSHRISVDTQTNMDSREHDDIGADGNLGNQGSVGQIPEPARAPETADRVTEIAHEINNMLDGSMRCLMLAQRAIDRASDLETDESSPLEQAHKHIDVAVDSLEQMGKMLHERMMAVSPIAVQRQPTEDTADGYPLRPSVAHVVAHACELVMPKARECKAEIVYEIDDACDALDSGPMYPVVLNGVLNAIEAIGLSKKAGRVTVLARCIDAGTSGTLVRVEILDDGPGLPTDVPVQSLFEHGHSTKIVRKGGAPIGIGLSLSKQIIVQAGGSIELRNRTDVDRGTAFVFIVPVRAGIAGGDLKPR